MAEKSVQLTGEWDALKRVLRSAAPKVRSESRRTLGRQLKRIEARVLGHVDSQDLEWKVLNEKYAARKEQQGLSPDILRSSNQMYSNITTTLLNDYAGGCGVKRGSRKRTARN